MTDTALADFSDDDIQAAIASIRALRESAIEGVVTELPALKLVGAKIILSR